MRKLCITGQYLNIHPSTLETLTRSGIEASTSRAHISDIDAPIREEEAGASTAPDPGNYRKYISILHYKFVIVYCYLAVFCYLNNIITIKGK